MSEQQSAGVYQSQAAKARNIALAQEQAKMLMPSQKVVTRMTIEEVYAEYCEKGRSGKAYSTIKNRILYGPII